MSATKKKPDANQAMVGESSSICSDSLESGATEINNIDQEASAEPAPQGPRIPKIIHHIWMGRAMSSAAMNNVKSWGAKAKVAGWKVFLGTDSTVNAMMDPRIKSLIWTADITRQFKELKKDGIKIADLSENEPMMGEELFNIYTAKAEAEDFAIASDIARYCILRAYGGVYIDVDVGPGTVDLTKQLRHLDPGGVVPHLGTPWRDKQAADDDLAKDPCLTTWDERSRGNVRTCAERSIPGNHFIATQKGAGFLDVLLNSILTFMKPPEKAPKLPEDLDTATTGIGGLLRAIHASASAEPHRLDVISNQNHVPLRVTPWIDDLEWVTADSEVG